MNWLSSFFGINDKNTNQEPESFTTRIGKLVPTDDVYKAWTSGNLKDMIKASNTKTNPIDRHFLLQSIVSESYKLRQDEKHKRICIEFSEKHITEFSQIAPKLKEEMDGILPRISTFQEYANVTINATINFRISPVPCQPLIKP